MPFSPRQIQQPEIGTYVIRLARRGHLVPVLMQLIEGRWLATVNGVPQSHSYSPEEVEAAVMVCLLDGQLSSHPFVKILAFGKKADQATYDRMIRRIEWAKIYAPDHPCLHPDRPVDLSSMPSPW